MFLLHKMLGLYWRVQSLIHFMNDGNPRPGAQGKAKAPLFRLAATLLAFAASPVWDSTAAPFAAIPAEVRSSHFVVAVNGYRTPVLHAAGGYYLLNFDVDGPTVVSVTAEDAHSGIAVWRCSRCGTASVRGGTGRPSPFRLPGR